MKLISTHSLTPWCSPVGFAVHQICEIFLSFTVIGWLLPFPCGCCGTPYQSWLFKVQCQFSAKVRSADYSKFVAVNENLRKAIEQEQKLVVVGTSRTFRRKEDIFVDLEIVSDSGLGLYLAAAWTYCFVLTDLYLTDPFKAYAIFLSNPIVVGLTCDYILAMPPNLIGFRRMFGSVFFCAFSSFVCLFILSLKLIVEFWRHRYVWAYRLAPSLRVWRYLAAPFVLLLTCAGRDCARRRDRDD